MKNSNCICIIAIMALVLSSCGSLSISQKRYSRGLNIDWFAAKEDKGAAQKQSTSKSKRTESIIAAEAPAQLDEPVMGGTKTESYVASSVVASKSVAPVSVKTSCVKAGKVVRTKSALGSKIASGMKVNASKMRQKVPLKIAGAKRVDATHDSDVSLLILIILAIVIPPLTVYLYFGEINIHFWLCLLFCFVGFGILNLYWGFGTLYALLTVFGIFG